jgi:hypothetical protein
LCRVKVLPGESIASMVKRKGGGGNAHDRAVAGTAGTDTNDPISEASKRIAPEKIENTKRKRARNALFVTAFGFPLVLLLIPKNPLTVAAISLAAGLVLAHSIWVYSENLRMPIRLMFSLVGLLALVCAGYFPSSTM